MKKRALVAMSGGVDSSAAALLMMRAGYQVVGMTALLFGDASAAGPCCGREGASSAGAVCEALGIEHHWIDLSELFEKKVIDRFISEYQAGRTPNPCSDCNRFIKFDTFFEYADKWDCEVMATGHYAQMVDRVEAFPLAEVASSGRSEPLLAKGDDENKDQSYFLACVAPERLARIRFPVGNLTKPEVRALAEEAGLPTAQRKESQDICFMYNGVKLKDLIGWHTGYEPQPGKIVREDGSEIGEHDGAELYTVGQRRGLGMGGGTEGLVVHKLDTESNTVVVAERDSHPIESLVLRDFVDMAPGLWNFGENLNVRARYRQSDWGASVEKPGDSIIVRPQEDQFSISMGQWCIGYKNRAVMFGGIIDRIEYQH